MAEPLLIVDVQVGFLNPFTRHIPERIARLIERGTYAPVLFTRFINIPESPYWRFLNWQACAHPPETDLAPELEPFAEQELTFAKPGYAGVSDELLDYLQSSGWEQITIAGIDTDMCVLKIAMDVFDLGIRPIILVDCCASTSGLQSHLAGLAVLARNIGAEQLRDVGLSEGRLGAPMFIDDAREEAEDAISSRRVGQASGVQAGTVTPASPLPHSVPVESSDR